MSPTPPVVVSKTLRRRRGLTEQAAVAAVDQACRRLRLPTIRAVLDEALSVAGKTFTDPRLCAAIVDRLTFNGTIIETGTDSYRLAHTLAQL
jgi:hypothetical protein